MKKTIGIITVFLAGFIFLSFMESPVHRNGGSLSMTDSLSDQRQEMIDSVLSTIKGKEKAPADSVFSNIRTFTPAHRIPVRHFLAVMDYWGEALGVGCNYCHIKGNWASDSLRTKRIARDMYTLRSVINMQLTKINDLRSKPAMVNCSTCHRGHALPQKE